MNYLVKNASPYAKAIFVLAKRQGQLQLWLDTLMFLGNLVQNTKLLEMISDPRCKKDKIDQLLESLNFGETPKACAILLHLLIKRRQLALLPQITRLLDTIIKKESNLLPIQVITAEPLSEEQIKNLSSVLKSKTKKQISLEPKISPNIIGGIILRQEDIVFDASIKGILQGLENKLKNFRE